MGREATPIGFGGGAPNSSPPVTPPPPPLFKLPVDLGVNIDTYSLRQGRMEGVGGGGAPSPRIQAAVAALVRQCCAPNCVFRCLR